jgi:hypothetical protein
LVGAGGIGRGGVNHGTVMMMSRVIVVCMGSRH